MFPNCLTVHLVVCEAFLYCHPSKYPQETPTPVIFVKHPTVCEMRLRCFIGSFQLVWQMVTPALSLQDDSSTPILLNKRGRGLDNIVYYPYKGQTFG